MLGGTPPPRQGLLSGLLGGQQPVDPMSYFQPRPGLLGDSPLGQIVRGGLAGLGNVAPGTRGLAALGQGAAGGQQAVQDWRTQQMRTALAGQEYQRGQQQYRAGQAAAAASNLQIAEALRQYNIMNRIYNPGAPDLTYADVINDPQKLSQVMSASIPANLGGQGGQAPTGAPSAPATPPAPIAPAYLTSTAPAQPSVAVQYPNQHGILVPGAAPPTPASGGGGPIDQLKRAFLQYEGGGDPNAVDKASGAIGGLMQSTFDGYNKQKFGGQLSFANPADRDKVNTQYLTDLYQQAGGDVNRIAAAYFTGQMAPAGSPTPWVDANAKDAHGTNVVDYVNGIRKNLGLAPLDASAYVAQGQPTTGQVVTAQGGALDDAAFARAHPGYSSLAQYREVAALTGNKEMQAEADKWDPALIGGTKATETAAGQQVTFGGQQAQYDRAQKLAQSYQDNKTVQLYQQTRPAADAFNAAFAGRGQAGGSSDYALISAALQVLNPGMTVAKPGTAEYATQLQTLPGEIQKDLQALGSTTTALPNDAVLQLKKAVDDRMAINQKLIDTVNKSYGDRAKVDAPQVGETYWNPDRLGLDAYQPVDAKSQEATKPPQYTPDHPATFGGDLNDPQAIKTWFNGLPIGTPFKNPSDPNGPPLTKTKDMP